MWKRYSMVLGGVAVGWSSRGLLHLVLPHRYFEIASLAGTLALWGLLLAFWLSSRSERGS